MTVSEAYLELRAYVIAAVTTAWSVDAYVGVYSGIPATGYAMVRLDGPIEIENDTPTTDVAMFTFAVAGRFAINQEVGAEAQAVGLASDLRVELLSERNPADIGFLPHVSSLMGERLDVNDDICDPFVVYTVRAVVDRG